MYAAILLMHTCLLNDLLSFEVLSNILLSTFNISQSTITLQQLLNAFESNYDILRYDIK